MGEVVTNAMCISDRKTLQNVWFVHEIIMLLLITVSMFRPDFIMNRVFPEYTTFNQNFNEVINYKEKRKIRLHVTRYTDYGERYKMFAFEVNSNQSISVLNLIGVDLEKNENNNYDVVNLEYMGPGEKIGIRFYDEVTKLEISSIDRPPKEYIYLFGLFMLMLTIFTQKRKLKLIS